MIQFNQSDPSFKTVAVLMTNAICLGCGLEVTRIGTMNKLPENFIMAFEGNPNGVNEVLIFTPYKLIEPISKDTWPESMEFEERPYNDQGTLRKKSINDLSFQSESTHLIQKLIIMSNFVYYFESVKDSIKNKFGPQSQWPDTLNFARVVRNAFAHGRGIYFKHVNDLPVHWKNYNYSYQDNGRQIIPDDMNIPEIIVLLKEMDSYI